MATTTDSAKTEVKKMNPPSALHGAMSRERKPFTYTPGGLDLSEIKSERMAKRLMRNAMNQGVPDLPAQATQSPAMPSTPIAVPNFNCLPVQVFPSFQLPANPKSLLRTRSTPDKYREPHQSTVQHDTQNVNNFKLSGIEQLRDTINNNTPFCVQVNNNRSPATMYECSQAAINTSKFTEDARDYQSNNYAKPALPEMCYDAEYFNAQPKSSDDQQTSSFIVPVSSENGKKLTVAQNFKTVGSDECILLPITDNRTAEVVSKPVEDNMVFNDDDEQREVRVVKKQIKKKVDSQNGEQNGSNEAETTVKLPTKKSAAKTETKVEVVKKVLPDGSVEEVKTTTTKTTIDGKTEITTKTETLIIPKEDEDEVEEVEEEEEEEEVDEEVVVQEPTTIVIKNAAPPPIAIANETVKKDSVVKKEEKAETTTKKVLIIQNSNEDEQEIEGEEEDEENDVEVEEVVRTSQKSHESQEKQSVEEKVVIKQEIVEKKELKDETKKLTENEEVVENIKVGEVSAVQEEKKEIEAATSNNVAQNIKEEEEEDVEEEEEFEEAEEPEDKPELKVEKQAELEKESKEQKEEAEESEYTEEEIESEKEENIKSDVTKNAVQPKNELEKEETEQKTQEVKIEVNNEIPQDQPVISPVNEKVPLREPSIPLEKVEDVEIKPIGASSETVSKTQTSSTEIIKSGNDLPKGTLSTQTEYNRIENIVTVNRTTKTLDHSYEQLTQQGVPTVKTYFAPDRERVSTSPQPSKPYQPVYPPSIQQQPERRHSLLLERLSTERQMPSDIYHNNYQYNSQSTEQQNQWSQEPQSEVINVSNVKPSTITNQQWYQQSRKENVIYNNVIPDSPAAPDQQWTQPQPQTQQQSQPQSQYQSSYTENISQDSARSTSNNFQQNSYQTYTPTPSNWATNNIASTIPSINTQPNQYSFLNKESSETYQKTTQQYSSSYVPPPWEQDPSYVAPPLPVQNYYQAPPSSSTFSPSSKPGWKPTPPAGKFSKSVATSYIPPAPNQSFVKPATTNVDPPKQPGRKTYYSEYERRYITVPESTYIPSETKFQPQPDPSPQYYYDNNEPSETVEPQWRKELREFTEKTSQTQTEQTSVKPPWEDEPKYTKVPTVTYTPTPSWSQTLRPQSYRERSFESEFVESNEWSKTNTLGRGRPLSSYGNSATEAPVPERTRGVSMDRYNPNNYQSPITTEHSPVQTHTLNPHTAPHGHHNPNVPAYHSRASAEPREHSAIPQPRNWGEARASPIQSRSFKYLQWITGTED